MCVLGEGVVCRMLAKCSSLPFLYEIGFLMVFLPMMISFAASGDPV